MKKSSLLIPLALGTLSLTEACDQNTQVQENDNIKKEKHVVAKRLYTTFTDIKGNNISLKSVTPVNKDYCFYLDSASQEVGMYKNRETQGEKGINVEKISGPYIKEEAGPKNYIKAFVDSVHFDLISQTDGYIIKNVNNVTDLGEGQLSIEKNGKCGLYIGNKLIIPHKYKNIINSNCGNIRGTYLKKVFACKKDNGYDILNRDGKHIASVDAIVKGHYIKNNKILLVPTKGEPFTIDGYELTYGGGDGAIGGIFVRQNGVLYSYGFNYSKSNTRQNMAKKKLNALLGINDDEQFPELDNISVEDFVQIVVSLKCNDTYETPYYLANDSRLLKPNKSESEIKKIINHIFSSEAKQNRGDFAFLRKIDDGSYVFSYKIIGRSAKENKEILQKGDDVKRRVAENFNDILDYSNLLDVFKKVGNNDIVDKNGEPINSSASLKPNERVYVKAKVKTYD